MSHLLAHLPRDLPAAVVVLMHRSPNSALDRFLADRIKLSVEEALDGALLRAQRFVLQQRRVDATAKRG